MKKMLLSISQWGPAYCPRGKLPPPPPPATWLGLEFVLGLGLELGLGAIVLQLY